jgi:hypothetical protein
MTARDRYFGTSISGGLRNLTLLRAAGATGKLVASSTVGPDDEIPTAASDISAKFVPTGIEIADKTRVGGAPRGTR